MTGERTQLKILVLVLIIAMMFQEPESGRRAPSNGQNRVDVGKISTEFLVEGAQQVQNQGERGGQGIVSQPHPILPPEPIFGSNQDGEGTFQDWMERDEDLPTSKAGSFGASIGGAECKNNLKSSKHLRSP